MRSAPIGIMKILIVAALVLVVLAAGCTQNTNPTIPDPQPDTTQSTDGAIDTALENELGQLGDVSPDELEAELGTQ